MKILFLQEFGLAGKGGGASIIRRLISYSPIYKVEICSASDKHSGNKDALNPGEESFFTLPRKARFGIGRLMGCLTIFRLDILAFFSIRQLIKKENPDIIHVLAHGVSFPLLAYAAKRSGKKVVLSVHDLWYWTVSGYISKNIADALFRKAIKDIDTVYVISQEMKTYLATQCGAKNYLLVHDGVHEAINKAALPFPEKEISLFYVGIMHSMQLALFDSLLDILDNEVTTTLTIGICSNRDYSPVKQYRYIKIINHGWLDEKQLRLVSAKYMYGILPLSFEKKDNLFYQTSLMTKIPFYIGAGLPIICIGPANASAVRLVKREGIGIAITTPRIENIGADLKSFLENRKMYIDYLQNIDRSAKSIFNMNIIADRFFKSFLPEFEMAASFEHQEQ